jgi:hypothetical protein
MSRAIALLLTCQTHSRRVAQLLMILWLLSMSDLALTLWAARFTPFRELNPVAHFLLQTGQVPALVMVKLSLTALGTSIFWHLRGYRRAEAALWLIVMVYVLLAARWSDYTAAALLHASV